MIFLRTASVFRIGCCKRVQEKSSPGKVDSPGRQWNPWAMNHRSIEKKIGQQIIDTQAKYVYIHNMYMIYTHHAGYRTCKFRPTKTLTIWRCHEILALPTVPELVSCLSADSGCTGRSGPVEAWIRSWTWGSDAKQEAVFKEMQLCTPNKYIDHNNHHNHNDHQNNNDETSNSSNRNSS